MKIFAMLTAIAVLVWSGIGPKDRATWVLEVLPCLIGLPILWWADRKYKIHPAMFALFCFHSAILCVGGHYTYAEVPAGFWFRDLLGLHRNHYDRLGHLLQGITPALIGYEIINRKKIVSSKAWTVVFCIALALSVSVIYEFVEWWTALISGEGATAFLGTQGDVWDTQWDMFMAFVGSILAMVFFSLKSRAIDK